ncbi:MULTISPECIES: Crp/Fnr family transcriptional regulator [unclassified Campylobacter]|uniref:Crp/Fnr family transcriptional regulator n=1 Tax=unclassified Campylobacter TaxID=2593542 RepID=UPI00123835F8|nr:MULTISPECIES: Crp/Fnr family transcriptional regulator [unclassified Campylobacter]KAA6224796.1 Crp/Fnr family transcriptional regulator [Campylobacter sp. LR185c]KAA6227371.1 Crp/Fnr family transcriptional regulator [Campylobacter sp. LR196d]KAA6228748.1 Crp/Fnr family transcriptional regulator [Campylobacter sp. LR286c]KAA6230802.1 Crp/Fnr family transcriptional regulator [Campylobacter sp. LR291e]KAA8604883.1 transcriptional regulator [Campylobacter sp. LR185c]
MQEYLEFLKNIGLVKKYPKKAILFYEGEIALNLLILIKGKVRVYKCLNDKELSLHFFTPASFIAEMATLKEIPYPANAECLEESEILEVNINDFKRLCKENEKFNMLLLSSLFEKIQILGKNLMQNSMPLRVKLLNYLLENERNLAKISQKQIASYLNIRVESLSRVIKELKIQGLINTKQGKIFLLDKEEIIKECI